MGRRVDVGPPVQVMLDEKAAGRRARQLGLRLAVEAVDPPDSPQFVDEPGVARRLAVARAEPDVFRRLALIEELWRERSEWAALRLAGRTS